MDCQPNNMPYMASDSLNARVAANIIADPRASGEHFWLDLLDTYETWEAARDGLAEYEPYYMTPEGLIDAIRREFLGPRIAKNPEWYDMGWTHENAFFWIIKSDLDYWNPKSKCIRYRATELPRKI